MPVLCAKSALSGTAVLQLVCSHVHNILCAMHTHLSAIQLLVERSYNSGTEPPNCKSLSSCRPCGPFNANLKKNESCGRKNGGKEEHVEAAHSSGTRAFALRAIAALSAQRVGKHVCHTKCVFREH